MNSKWLSLVSILVLVWLSACASQPQPTSTPPPIAQNTATALPPTATVTVTPAASPIPPTLTTIPNNTATPRPAVTHSPTLNPNLYVPVSPTPLTLPEISWQQPIAHQLEGGHFIWSPVANEGASSACAPDIGPGVLTERLLLFTSAPAFEQTDLTPPGFFCVSPFFDWQWHPEGQQLYFFAPRAQVDETTLDYYDIWRMNKDGSSAEKFTDGGKLATLDGWLADQYLVHTEYQGGDNSALYITDLITQERQALGWTYNSFIYTVTPDFVVANHGRDPEQFYTAIAVLPEKIRPGEVTPPSLVSPFMNYLSMDVEQAPAQHFIFNSRVLDWLPNTQQLLVLTWPTEISLGDVDIHHDATVSKLQMWNVADNSLIELVPGAIEGHFSPDRTYLAYVLPTPAGLSVQLLNRVTGEIVFTSPIFLEFYSLFVMNHFRLSTFAPDGRYFTFYRGAEEQTQLVIYDLTEQKIAAELPAFPPGRELRIPHWSPTAEMVAYVNENNQWAVYDLVLGQPIALSDAGTELVYRPQWSFDGQYLSLSVLQADQTERTVMIETAGWR